MNRAIDKYRVWDDEKKEYVSSRVFINHHGETCLIKNGCFYPHKVTKERCTGLTDRHGKLIYENDIVETVYRDGSTGKRRVVYVVEDARFMLTPFPLKEYPIYWNCEKYIFSTFKIIGNIHDEQFREVTKMVEDKDNGTDESKS